METPDVYHDQLAPTSEKLAVIYRVKVGGDKWNGFNFWANLYVEESNYCELHGWKWGEHRQPRPAIYNSENRHLMELEQEVWKWLVEWGLVELRAIGPEDSEYFATEELIGK